MNIKLSIKKTADIFGVNTNKLRFYERKGLLESERGENNYRYYSKEQIEKLQLILMYRQLNFSIEDIKNIFEESGKRNMLQHLDKQWKIINDEMSRLRLLKTSVESLMDRVYEEEDGNFTEDIIEAASKLKEKNEIQNSWEDRWNFNDWAERYDTAVEVDFGQTKIYKNYNEVLEATYKRALDGIEDTENMKVLDIGVGTGNLSRLFIENNMDVTGIDQSREMMNKAKQKFPGMKLRLGEFLKIPYEDNKFNIIVSTYAFHHLTDEEKKFALKEMLRVLKEDGKIVIGDMMFQNIQEKNRIFQSLSEDEKMEIEDEYYTDIESFGKEVAILGKELSMEKIDRFMNIIEVK